MFDIGFSEMIVIAVVALIVIGPERLPAVARTVGTLLGRIRRYANDVKAEVNRELQLEDLRKMQEQLAEQARALEQQTNHEASKIAGTFEKKPSPVEEQENSILPPKS